MKREQKLKTRRKSKFLDKHCEIILYLSIAIYIVIFSYLTILRYEAFKTRAWDLGIFNQALWATLKEGRLFYHTTELYLNPSGCFFGVHFSPILFLTLPIYALYPSPETLLIFQTIILALASLPLYSIAKNKLNSKPAGLLFSTAYLLYPATHWVNWNDFHVQAFLPLFFFLALRYMLDEKWIGYFSFIVLALMCEEHVCFITTFLGVYLALRYRKRILPSLKHGHLWDSSILVPLITMVMAIVWFAMTLWIRDTFFQINPEFYSEFLGAPNFTILGIEDPLQLPLCIILKPYKTLEALAYDGPAKLLYLGLLFGPLMFLSFKSWLLLPTLPWFGFALLSQTRYHHLITNHYSPYILPFIFVSAICAAKRRINLEHSAKLSIIKGYAWKILLLSFIFFLVSSPLGPLINIFFSSYGLPQITEHEVLLSKAVSLIPSDASVLTQNNLFPPVSSRLNAYVIPHKEILNLKFEKLYPYMKGLVNKVDFVFIDYKSDPYTGSILLLLIRGENFGLLAYGDEIYLYKRGYYGETIMLNR